MKESPSENPPYITQDPVTVIASIRRLISKVWLVSLNPCIGICLAEMPIPNAQFSNEFVSVQTLVYDKRNVAGLEGAREIILAELTKRVHQIFPDAEVKVKPMQANGLNSDASKSDREKLNRMLEEIVAVIVLFRIGHIALSYQV